MHFLQGMPDVAVHSAEFSATRSNPARSLRDVGESWSQFSEQWVEPLILPLTWSLSLAATLVVSARLLVPVIQWSKKRTSSKGWALRYGGGSIPTIVLSSMASAVIITYIRAGFIPGVFGGWVLCGAFTAAFAAAWWCWWWLGARPRVAVRVMDLDGNASVSKSALLTHYVDELGAAPPRGVEHPSASDLTRLLEATSKVKENAWIAWLVAIVEFIGNSAPWQVEVQYVDRHTLLVDLSWNRKPIVSDHINLNEEDLPDPDAAPDALEQMAAASVATAMSQHYVDWTGLYGATKWRSVGLHHVASGLPSDDAQRLLLMRAVAADPANALADTFFQNNSYQKIGREALELSIRRTESDRYLGVLRTSATDLARLAQRRSSSPDDEPNELVGTRHGSKGRREPPTPSLLLARTLLVWMAVVRNRVAMEQAARAAEMGSDPAPYRRNPDEVRIFWELWRLMRELGGELDAFEGSRLLAQMRARTAISIHRLYEASIYNAEPRNKEEQSDSTNLLTVFVAANSPETETIRNRVQSLKERWQKALPTREVKRAPVCDIQSWFADAKSSKEPSTAYAYLCYLAMSADFSPIPPDQGSDDSNDEFRKKLAIVLLDPSNADRLRRDPELYQVQDAYWDRLHCDRPTDVWEVKGLAAKKETLRKIGLKTVSAVASAPAALHHHLDMSRDEFRELQEVAALAVHLEQRTGAPFDKRVPLFLKVLVDNDIDSVGLLQRTPPETLLNILSDAVGGAKEMGSGAYIPRDQALKSLLERWGNHVAAVKVPR